MAGGMNVQAQSILWAPTGQGTVPVHPLYLTFFPDWLQMQDTYMGERRVKEQNTKYLPPTSGQEADGMTVDAPGWKDYQAYKKRAVFHNLVYEGIQAMVGVMHRKPPRVELPKRLEPMLQSCTTDDEPVEVLLRRINTLQLQYGRLGILLESPTAVDVNRALPYLVTYDATAVVNWDVGTKEIGEKRIKMVVLNESEWERRSTFNWAWTVKHRVLVANPQELIPDWSGQAEQGYAINILRDGRTDPAPADFVFPAIGGRKLDFVPFVFVNTNDLVPEPDQPPLIGLSNTALAAYRGEADYRQNLYLQGQDTLVVIGVTEREDGLRTGAGAVLDLPIGGDAKYAGVSNAGLGEQRQAVNDLLQRAAEMGSKLLDFQGTGRAQSGDALRIRVAARTTTLFSVARTGAAALEQMLRYAAEWVGADPEEVIVEPNLDFAQEDFGGQDLLYFMQAKQMGAPISLQSVHNVLKEKDLTDLSYEEEMDQIELEAGSMLGMNQQTRGVPSEPVEGGNDLTDETRSGVSLPGSARGRQDRKNRPAGGPLRNKDSAVGDGGTRTGGRGGGDTQGGGQSDSGN